jgi:hypothetical protein
MTKTSFGQAFELFYLDELVASGQSGLFSDVVLSDIQDFAEEQYEAEFQRKRAETVPQLAGDLAASLHTLVNERWEANPNVFLKLIDEAGDGLNALEFRELMLVCQELFRDKFGDSARERGESPLLIDQIIKRIGEDYRKALTRVLSSADIREVSEALVASFLTHDLKSLDSHLQDINKLTRAQLRGVEIFSCFEPARRVAKALADSVSTELEEETDEQIASVRSLHDFLSSVQEMSSSKSSGDVDREKMMYCLNGRRKRELEIITHYLARYLGSQDESSFLESCLSTCCSNVEKNELLRGYQLQGILDEISKILRYEGSTGLQSQPLVPLSSSPKELERLNDLTGGSYLRRRVLRQHLSSTVMARLCFLDLQRLLIALREDQRSEVYRATEARFEVDLREILHPLSSEVEIIELVIRLRDNIHLVKDFDLALSLLAYRPPELVAQIEKEYFCLFGEKLKTELLSLAANGEVGSELRERKKRIALVTGTVLRSASSFEAVRFAREKSAEMKENSSALNSARQVAQSVKRILGSVSVPASERLKQALSALGARPLSVRKLVPSAYYQDGGSKSHLAVDFSSQLGEENLFELYASLLDLDPRASVSELYKDVRNLMGVCMHPISVQVAIVSSLLSNKRIERDGLADSVRKLSVADQSIVDKSRCYEVLYLSECLEVRQLVSRGDSSCLALLRGYLERVPEQVLAWEDCYDYYFSNLRISLLRKFKNEFNRDLSQVFLLLECLPLGFNEQVRQLIDSGDLFGLEILLRDHIEDIDTISECYALFYKTSLSRDIEEKSHDKVHGAKIQLILRGFDPDAVSTEIRSRIHGDEGDSVGVVLLSVLRDGKHVKLPKDKNWVVEMYDQVRRSYRERFGPHMITELRLRSVPIETIHEICYILYGKEAAYSAVKLNKVLQADMSEEDLLDQVSSIFASVSKRQVERIVDMYDDFFSTSTEERASLRESLLKKVNADSSRKMLESLISREEKP